MDEKHFSTYDSIMKTHIVVHRILSSNEVMFGGMTMLERIAIRVQKEMEWLVFVSTMIRVATFLGVYKQFESVALFHPPSLRSKIYGYLKIGTRILFFFVAHHKKKIWPGSTVDL